MPPELIAAVPLVVSILGALGVGGLIGQWYASRKDRRDARAAVLRALASVESARWTTGHEAEDYRRLREALRDLETAALIAQLPRSTITEYRPLTFATLWDTTDEYDRYGCAPEEAAVDSQLHEAARFAAETISLTVWSGAVLRRARPPWRRRGLKRRIQALTDEEVKSRVKRGHGLH